MNKYLEVLQLQPGATTREVKAAYRRLSKIYHPDISKDPDAKEKFIEISEAYQFLTTVGPRPNQESVSYAYDPEESAYEKWRREAKARARKRAFEEERMQQELIKKVLRSFGIFGWGITLFNVLLLIDYFLPRTEFSQTIMNPEVFYPNKQSSYDGPDSKYDIVRFENFVMHFESGEFGHLVPEKDAVVTATPLLRKPLFAEFTVEGHSEWHYQAINIYIGFFFLVPLLLGFAAIYKYGVSTLDGKLTMATFMTFFFLIEIYILMKY